MFSILFKSDGSKAGHNESGGSVCKGGSRGVERVTSHPPPHFELTHKKNIRSKLPAHIFW